MQQHSIERWARRDVKKRCAPRKLWYNALVLNLVCAASNAVKSDPLRRVYAASAGLSAMTYRSKAALLVILAIIFTLIPAPLSRAQAPEIPEAEQVERAVEANRLALEEKRVTAITSTIALLETAGTLDCSKQGLSGEKGCHQFMPSTWRSYSTEVFGYVAVQTPENATTVVNGMVRKWLDEGYTERDIFLTWNQGHPGQCRRGVNKHGVAYDSCAYVQNALSKLAEISTS